MTDRAVPRSPNTARSSGSFGEPVSGRPHYTPPPPRSGRAPSPAAPGRTTGRDDRQPVPADTRDRSAAPRTRDAAGRPHTPGPGHERGLPGWQALVVLLVVAGIGGFIDLVSGTAVRGGFNYGIVLASLVAILAVRRSGMFPVVVAPPIVYFIASAVLLLVRSHGLSDKGAALDVAINWLVYGFPAIAAASAIVLIVAGVRMIVNR